MNLPTSHYVEYGGGLGDVFHQMYTRGCYNGLSELSPADRVQVALICANPHAAEIFAHHPKASQLEVRSLGWWPWERDGAKREEHGLPPSGTGTVPRAPGPVEFYLHPSDEEVLRSVPLEHLSELYIVFAAGAGQAERNIPERMLHTLLDEAKGRGYVPVLVGRTYDRHGRYEPLKGARVPGVIDLTDRLSVPGVARLVQRSAGAVCSHSAVNILAGLERRPQLLLYPESVRDTHIRARDQWAFSVDLPETVHGCFTDWNGHHRDWIRWFFQRVKGRPDATGIPTVPYPEEARAFAVADEPRLTPEWDLRALLHLISRTRGAIVEIGCNLGRTTRDIATAFPDRPVLAIDWTGARGTVTPEQAVEVPEVLAELARHLPNVHVFDMPSRAVRYDLLERDFGPIGCVYIDGDHSDRGVHEDSTAALLHASRSAEEGHPVTLVWHDYYAGAPEWCGVKRYVDTLSLGGLPVRHIEATWLAYLTWSSGNGNR
jgi:Methyltransferase domain